MRPEELEIGVPRPAAQPHEEGPRLPEAQGYSCVKGLYHPPGWGAGALHGGGSRAWCWDCSHTGAPCQDVADGPCRERSPPSSGAEAHHLDLSLPSVCPPIECSTAPAVGCGGVCKWDGAVRRFLLTSAISSGPAGRAVLHASLTSPRAPHSHPPPCPSPQEALLQVVPSWPTLSHLLPVYTSCMLRGLRRLVFFHLKIISDL